MILIQNKNIDSIKWNDLLLHATDHSPFQTEEFFRLFNSSADLRADVFAVEEDSVYRCLAVVTVREEKGLLSLFSARGIIYGGIVIRDNNADALELLLSGIDEYYNNKLIYIEVRNSFDHSRYRSVFEKKGWKYQRWLNIKKEIPGSNELLAEFSSSRKRQVKKAFKTGITAGFAENVNDIIQFYQILSRLYREKIKKPLLPLIFFIKAFESGFADFLLVRYSDRIIGGIMLVVHEGKAVYEFYVCGLDKEFHEQYPSVISTWAGIDYASRRNIPVFDFMGAGTPDKEYGVRDFKKRFGGRIVEHGRFIKVCSPVLYGLGKKGLNLIHLPKRIGKYAS